MFKIQSLPFFLTAAFSLWSIIIIIFQKFWFSVKKMDRRFLFIAAYLVFLLVLEVAYLLGFTEAPLISESDMMLIANIGLTGTLIFIFLLDNIFVKKNVFCWIRGIIYLLIFGTIIISRALMGSNTDSYFGRHLSLCIFLIGEVFTLFFNVTKASKIQLMERIFLSGGYFLMFIINIADLMNPQYFLLFGIGIMPVILPFYLIYQYSRYKDKIRHEIILFDEISNMEQDSYISSINMIVSLLESKNTFLKGHSEKVSFYATLIGTRVGLSFNDLEMLNTASLLHDIGYIGISMELYTRKAFINLDDLEKIKRHTLIGKEILEKSTPFAKYADIVLHHHEHWNGTGYPYGIAGEKIPFFSRIIQIADTFDALTTDRFYRSALSKEDAVLILKTGRGEEFDPLLTDLFLESIKSEVV